MQRQTYCNCAGKKVPVDECDRCPADDWIDDDYYDDQPLYPPGKLASMTLEELEKEGERQSDRQGRLGDAEVINEYEVERTEARCRAIEDEIRRRTKSGCEQ
ncbi:hypothetical protein EZH22_24300 [Xanthobacter dioxanivorans]|uniref:Uncharacterized protein n=1 Tax=Xanthobacter dioxanivorans TaxID=2528964 RepID=A0A974PMS6_9HYPH|nr:hypothetical protein [Xanthobacter dioxanivorans]QRG06076.1 hypothetical protein EZH22_24300 [Xanthobacter dioxanivorans]